MTSGAPIRLRLGFLLAVLAIAIAFVTPGAQDAGGRLGQLVASGRVAPQVADAVAAGESVDSIVVFEHGIDPDAMEAAVANAGGSVELIRSWDSLSMTHVLVHGTDGLTAIATAPGVRAVQANERFEAATLESRPIVNQPAAQDSGFTGDGTTVAVLDTGARCDQLPEVDGECPVVWAEDFAPDDGVEDDHDHGTNVTGIVLAMAPGARIAALDVFTKNEAGQHFVASADALAAIEAIIERRDELNIVSVNLSLGGGLVRHPLRCPLSPYANAFASLREAGIIPVVAAGNGPYSGSLFFNGVEDPACAPGSLVVGAVYDADYGPLSWPQASLIFPRSACSDPVTGPEVVTCFSQSASYLGVLAPGARITAAGIEMVGTSQATPHVAGAIAVLAAAAPGSTVEQREAAIVNSGVEIFDPRNGVTKRRLELCGALSAVGAACGGEAGISFQRQAAPEGAWRYYYVDVPEGTELLTVSISGSGDADLYTRAGTRPDQNNAACAQENPSANETCLHADPAAGRWWIGVYGFEDAEFTVTTGTSDVVLVPRATVPMVAGGSSGAR